MEAKIAEEERSKSLLSNITNQTSQKSTNDSSSKTQTKEWNDEEVKLLVKGAQVIPIGTRDRWDVIANFIKEHSRGKYNRSGKEVLAKTKEMQKLDPTTKEEVNKRAYEKAVQNKKTEVEVKEKPSERYICKNLITLIKLHFICLNFFKNKLLASSC